jgi:hypothetical protein
MAELLIAIAAQVVAAALIALVTAVIRRALQPA